MTSDEIRARLMDVAIPYADPHGDIAPMFVVKLTHVQAKALVPEIEAMLAEAAREPAPLPPADAPPTTELSKAEALDVIEQMLCGFVIPRPPQEDPEIGRVTKECHARAAIDLLAAHGRDVEYIRFALRAASETPAPEPGERLAILLGDLEYWRIFCLRSRRLAGEGVKAPIHIEHLTALSMCIKVAIERLHPSPEPDATPDEGTADEARLRASIRDAIHLELHCGVWTHTASDPCEDRALAIRLEGVVWAALGQARPSGTASTETTTPAGGQENG